VLELGGWTVLDDTYNANPTSVVAAASALLALPGGTAIAVLGVMAELGPESEMLHESTGRRLRELGVDRLVAVGDGAQGLAAGFAAAGGGAASCPDAVAAVRWLEEHATAGARILVKGSRVAGMEEVVTRLESLAPDEPGGAARGE
jgi:UDP-N-acetylmuramoyl-tripeptide--D-alanyl-D-alanine ligase